MKSLLVVVLALCVAACSSSDAGDGGANPDADRDGFAGSADCNDGDATVWRTISVFADADRDGTGAGSAVNLCAGASTPPGYASSSTDCADSDAAVHTLMPYAAQDRDGDTFRVASSGSVCGNGTSLPSGYFAAAAGGAADCDDGSASVWMQVALHEDFDRDGVGAGAASSFCLGAAGMPGFVSSSFDCDPVDATKWRIVATYQDVDGDGVGSGTLQRRCVGSGAPPGSSFLGYDPLDTTDPGSAIVSDFDLNIAALFIESEADDDDLP